MALNRPEGGVLLSTTWPRQAGEKVDAPHFDIGQQVGACEYGIRSVSPWR
jgi:hypothetical protein